MKKFKNAKRIFALILAVAVVAMSMFTGVVVSADCGGTTDEWMHDAVLDLRYDDYYLVSDRVVGSGSQADPYIISTAEQLASLCTARFKNSEDKYDADEEISDLQYLLWSEYLRSKLLMKDNSVQHICSVQ